MFSDIHKRDLKLLGLTWSSLLSTTVTKGPCWRQWAAGVYGTRADGVWERWTDWSHEQESEGWRPVQGDPKLMRQLDSCASIDYVHNDHYLGSSLHWMALHEVLPFSVTRGAGDQKDQFIQPQLCLECTGYLVHFSTTA